MVNKVVKVSYAEPNNQIAIVTLNRPENYNSLTVDVLDGLIEAAGVISTNSQVKAVILTGAGKFFSSGADFSIFEAAKNDDDVNNARRIGAKGSEVGRAWEAMPQPTIAAIEGGVVGGALGIAMALDWRVMGKGSYAYVSEVLVGVNFGWGSLPRLNNLVGPAKAKLMSIFCKKHKADECLAWGLADYVTDNGATMDKAMEMAEEICALPRLPVQLIKRGINATANVTNTATSFADLEDLLLCFTDQEANQFREQTLKSIKK
ncbi:MAG: enoyl-CoA hydratase/isomerase family protein [Kordiimonadaceae bacterium]|jgi:enoyl-CoA hydratase|nr:enoyl-CoA hydratase/isomerase family protein [Kordiimonadaceae bacterium]MBT6032151.1 enoyl-CoA hydratase/isomerase family protein [Kordiimonadaceae bacterium]